MSLLVLIQHGLGLWNPKPNRNQKTGNSRLHVPVLTLPLAWFSNYFTRSKYSLDVYETLLGGLAVHWHNVGAH